MHVLDLQVLVVGPLEMEAQHRDAPPIDDRRIELAVGVGVRDHLAAAGRTRRTRRSSGGSRPSAACRSRRRAIRPAGLVRRRGTDGCRRTCRIPACAGRRRSRCDSRAGNRACGCRATTACRGASRDAPSSLCGTLSIMRGMKPRTLVPVVSVRYLPTVPLALARPSCDSRRRVEEDARRLAGARGKHHDAGADVRVASGGLVDVGHAGREPALVGRHFARHRVGDEGQAARSLAPAAAAPTATRSSRATRSRGRTGRSSDTPAGR